MASLRKHRESRFWFVRFRDPDTAKWREESTHLLHSDEKQTRAAQRLRDKRSAEENQLGSRRDGAWSDWVPGFIAQHYRSDSTRRRAVHGWERLSEWLRVRNLRHPREIRYEHGSDYLTWRKTSAGHNTALYEIKFLAFLINEAIRREYADRNVLARLGVGRAAVKEKPELTDADIAAFRAAAKDDWMRTVFEIQLYTGCRFSEASIPIERIDFATDFILIEDAKRKDTDSRKFFRVPLHPNLKDTLRRLEGHRTVPILTREMNWRYNDRLKRATGATSHSLRVTFITRCHRAGLSEREAMRLVNHSSKLVHEIYSRLGADDLRSAQARVALPPPPVRG